MNPQPPQISGLPLPQSPTAGNDAVSAMPGGASAPVVPQPPMQSSPSNNAAVAVNIPEDTDEANAIDEAWINKAHEIVDQTRDDPYAQSLALNRVRADYLKARYNKDIKINEDAAK